MRKLRNLTESDLHRIVRNVVNEISAGQMGGNGGGNSEDSRLIMDIKREGYQAHIGRDGNLAIIYNSRNGLSKSEAMKFYSLTTRIIDSGWTLKEIVPSPNDKNRVFFIFYRNKFTGDRIQY